MANKEALRELQSRLAERLKAAQTQERGRSWLAVECAGHGFLFPLQEAGEIFPFTPAMPVPYTSRWFMGVANLRGRLHGVVDLAGFLGVNSTETKRANQDGVNLDEEAANMLQFQQAYQASAKMIQVAQNLFDTLLQNMR